MKTKIAFREQIAERCVHKLTASGVGKDEAEFVADVLVHADLRGVESHGVMRLEHYIAKIEAGGINPRPDIKLSRPTPALAIVHGDDGLGHLVAGKAMETAIQLAREHGIGLVSVNGSSHCGALSYYVKMAASHRLIALMMVNTDKLVVPFGAASPYFGTNPLAYAIPAKRHRPIVLDMATSTVAYGKILYALENGLPIPPGWAVDDRGQPTEDPRQARALLPFGGAKGYGLSLLVDVCAGLLTGSPFGPHVPAMYGDYARKRGLGQFIVTIDPDKCSTSGPFAERVDQMIDELRRLPPAPGIDAVKVPGELEDDTERERLRHGIPVPETLYDYLFDEEANPI
ncbi:ureidoglycolate dehydrogenase [Paenibacillus oceani]|uniref:Ureidoglycolate dehydrogenase n=1 Tax=Paenibacillus oceani TaxID=2772510 RepID=A0A927GZ71_9BACL|nr:ureidoglycolate dehydrogenase [Paenibacillus oceani]MBD2862681.1 ureidoglycolate dehydrogenase [Paenibacillus oceani]